MTDPEHDPELERNLTTLFDRSARTPSDEEQVRLLAHARGIGKRGGPGAMTRVVWAPALAAAAAVAYLVAAPPGGKESAPRLGPGSANAPAAEQAPLPRVGPPADTAASLATPEPEDPLTAVLGGDEDELDLGPLMGGGPRANDEGAAGMNREKSWSNQEIERSRE